MLSPRVLMRPEDDEFETMVRAARLRRHLTEDQQAYLADVWREYQSTIRKSERATKAAAVKAGSLSSDADDKQGHRVDSRRDAAMEFKIPENKLKSIRDVPVPLGSSHFAIWTCRPHPPSLTTFS